MFTKKEMIDITKKQLAKNYNCALSDFDQKRNTWIKSNNNAFFKLLIFQGQAIISSDETCREWIEKELLDRNASWFFDFHMLRKIDQKLNLFGYEIENIYNYYLPNQILEEIQPLKAIKWFEKEEILKFKDDPRFDEAFIFDDEAPDILGVAAYEGNQIIAMAGASQNYDILHEVGINVDSNYESQGIGTNLITLLKQELFKRGKIPFYKTAISHISSRNLCIKAGFFPAWVEIDSQKKT